MTQMPEAGDSQQVARPEEAPQAGSSQQVARPDGAPQTGDSLVDEAIATFRATSDAPLPERAAAAAEAQRALQARLADSSPGNDPAAALHRVADASQRQ